MTEVQLEEGAPPIKKNRKQRRIDRAKVRQARGKMSKRQWAKVKALVARDRFLRTMGSIK